jgi:hypothetical protein
MLFPLKGDVACDKPILSDRKKIFNGYPLSPQIIYFGALMHFVEASIMQIIAQCPGCSNAWLLDDSAADRRIKCRNCQKLFKVPKLDDVPKAIKVIKHAKGTIYVDQNGKTYG